MDVGTAASAESCPAPASAPRRPIKRSVQARAGQYRKAMFAFAMACARDADVAEDLVQAAFLDALGIDQEVTDDGVIHFLFALIKNRFMNEVRHRKVRQRTISTEDLTSEVDRIPRLSTAPNQQAAMELSEAEELFPLLEPGDREMLRLRALEYNDLEIAAMLQVNPKTVRRRIEAAQTVLCRAAGRPDPLSGHQPRSGYRGVAKCGPYWQAYHGTGANRLYLGIYESVEDAALAFDLAAMWRLGDRAILNFPQMRDELRGRIDAGERPGKHSRSFGEGKRTHNQKLVETDIPVIRQRLATGEAHGPIAKDYGVHFNLISEIKRGKKWAHVQ